VRALWAWYWGVKQNKSELASEADLIDNIRMYAFQTANQTRSYCYKFAKLCTVSFNRRHNGRNRVDLGS
jgi:hypothetical protein